MGVAAWSDQSLKRAFQPASLADVLLAERPIVPAPHPLGQRHHRTIFISDIHLGTRGCKAELLGDFLARNACEKLYLVGDIVDGWRLRQRWYWPQAHSHVLHQILNKVDEGTKVIFVPGNHDEVFRPFCGRTMAGITVVHDAIHVTADGRKLLVLHGDKYDGIITYARWLALLGDWAYTVALKANEGLDFMRRRLGLSYWSLSAYLKQKVKNAVEFICRFEEAVARDVQLKGLDGVVCGHIHHAAIKDINGIRYHNDGDWVESCTALVEDARGNMEILCWAAQRRESRVYAGLSPAKAIQPA